MKSLLAFVFMFISFTAFGQEEIMIDGAPCGMHGSSKEGRMEYRQNVFKNRFRFPEVQDFRTDLSLDDFVNGSATAGSYSQNQAVEITGYVFEVKKGGIETCNCKTSNMLFRDAHIEITLGEQHTGKKDRFVVEVTPRLRMIMENQGIDWSTPTLKETLEGRMVKIQGWLFYDSSHRTENYADDPDDNIGRRNWRATSWEIHPVTDIEILDPTGAMPVPLPDPDRTNVVGVADLPAPTGPINLSATNAIGDLGSSTPKDILVIVILGAILGMAGQGLRVIVGLKKVGDMASALREDSARHIKYQQIVLSLLIAFAIGAVAGVLAAVGSVGMEFDRTTVVAFIAAGYAGTDFIEGFIKKYNVKPDA